MAAAGTGKLAVVAIAIRENEKLSARDALDQRGERLSDHVTGVAGPETRVECRTRDRLLPLWGQEEQLDIGWGRQ